MPAHTHIIRLSRKLVLLVCFIGCSLCVAAQVDENKLGSWYKYAFNADIKNTRWGIQGDVQHRNWNISSDLEQLILRSSVYYTPENSRFKLSMGYAYSQSVYYGNNKIQNHENRIYQEARFTHTWGSRLHFSHRVRFEQRFIQGQDFRTRYRYSLGVAIPLNHKLITTNTLYIAAYDEIFFNGQTDIGTGTEVTPIDRNRIYCGIGYIISSHIRVTLGFLNQNTSSWKKNQVFLSVLHSF